MREKQGPFVSRRYNVKNWRLITDDFGNEAWWFKCSKCSTWKIRPTHKKPTVYYCPPCHRRDKRERYAQLQADQERYMEALEVRRLKYFDRRVSQGLPTHPEQGRHRLRFKERDKRELLPIDPIREFIINKIGRPYGVKEWGERWGIGERNLTRMLNKKTRFVEFETVDQILTIEGHFIWDFYPKEYEEMLEKVA